MDNGEDKPMTTKEAADYIGYSPRTLEYWRLDDDSLGPKWYKPRGKVVYFKSDLDYWLKEVSHNV